MKYLFTFAFMNIIVFISVGQGTVEDALETAQLQEQETLTSIAKIQIQDLGDGTGIVKVWVKSSEVENLDYLSMQFSGRRIPRSTVLSILKSESTINSSDGTHMILMTSSLVLNAGGGNEVSYIYKKSGPRNFRNLEPGQVLIFPPIEKN